MEIFTLVYYSIQFTQAIAKVIHSLLQKNLEKSLSKKNREKQALAIPNPTIIAVNILL